jgi:hypothetical protein
MSNLQFIKSVSLTSSASTLSVTNCFSEIYDVYMLTITSFDQATDNTYLNMRLIDSSGSVITDSEYDFAELQMATYAAYEDNKNENQTVMMDRLNFNRNEGTGVGIIIHIFNPFDSSSYTSAKFKSSGVSDATQAIGFRGVGMHKVTEQITGVNFFMDTGNIDSATVNVYGIKR